MTESMSMRNLTEAMAMKNYDSGQNVHETVMTEAMAMKNL